MFTHFIKCVYKTLPIVIKYSLTFQEVNLVTRGSLYGIRPLLNLSF